MKVNLLKFAVLLSVLVFNCSLTSFSQKVYNNGLFRVYINGKVGFVDSSGKIVVQPKYDSVSDFNSQCNCATAKNEENLWGIINIQGDWIVPPKFTTVGVIGAGYVPVQEKGENKFKFIDVFGNVLVSGFDFVRSFSNGLAAVNIDNKWGFINLKGEIAIPPKYTLDGYLHLKMPQLSAVGDFSDGLAGVIINGKQFYIRPDDTVAFVLDEGMFGGDFSEGLAVVWKNEKYGVIQNNGKIILQPVFSQIETFSEGLAAFRDGVSWGYLNKEGKVVVKPIFEQAKEFKNDLAAVKINGKWGFIDKTGKLVIKPKYDNAENFQYQLANVESDEQEFFINKQGKIAFKVISK